MMMIHVQFVRVLCVWVCLQVKARVFEMCIFSKTRSTLMAIQIEKVMRKELCASMCFVLIFSIGFCEIMWDNLWWGSTRSKGSW